MLFLRTTLKAVPKPLHDRKHLSTFCESFDAKPMLMKQVQVSGAITGWVPSFFENPTYQGEPADYRLKVLVQDASEIVDEISAEYDRACDWYRSETGKKNFFDPPFELNEDGSAVIKFTAKPVYGEFPFPVVDSELIPISKDLILMEGTQVIVAAQVVFHPRKSMRGGIRLCPKGIQIVEAVTSAGRDSGDFDITAAFSKRSGFKQAKPNVKELATITSEDPDF